MIGVLGSPVATPHGWRVTVTDGGVIRRLYFSTRNQARAAARSIRATNDVGPYLR